MGEVSRRQLLTRVGGAGLAGAALALGGPGAIGVAAALEGDVLVVDLDRLGEANLQIQSAINSLPQDASGYGTGTIYFCGDGGGSYALAEQIVLTAKRDVHLVFGPDVSFRVETPADTYIDYVVNIIDTERCSITGLGIDAANKLVFVSAEGAVAGSAVAIVQDSNELVFDSCTFTNVGGDVGVFVDSTPAPPPDAIRITGAPSTGVTIKNCDFELVRTAVDAISTIGLVIDSNIFSDLLDELPVDSVAAFGAGEIEIAGGRIAGGSFVTLSGTCANVTISSNRTRPGGYAYGAAEVGGSLILTSPAELQLAAGVERSRSDPGHSTVTIRDNVFVGRDEPWELDVNNGASGDVITVKNVVDFTVERNVINRCGEFGIVVSHGSLDGDVRENLVKFADGSGIAIGAQNSITDGIQGNPRVVDVRVIDNALHSCGIDGAGDLGRYRATPRNSLIFNYPNAISSLRVWNARGVAIAGNAIIEYRSCGIWVKHTFANAEDRDNNQVSELTIDRSNTMSPYRSTDPDLRFFQPSGIDPDDAGPFPDFEPWTGPSRLYNVSDDGVLQILDQVVSGFDASRFVGLPGDDPGNPWLTDNDEPEVILADSCLSGNGRIDLFINNNDYCAAHTYSVTIGALSPRTAVVEARGTRSFAITGRPDGPLQVTVVKDGAETILDRTVTVACDVGQPALAERVWKDAQI